MKKVLSIIALLLMGMMVQAKTTYIPKYRSYLHIISGSDTLAVANNLDTLELADKTGLFALRIDHEDITKEKVKAIKRSKRAAGWAIFSAVMNGVSMAFSDNSVEYFIKRDKTRIATDIATIFAANAKDEQTLEIDMWIDNTCGNELMVCDMERGLTWWIMPHESLQLKLNNPEAARLRISDPQNKNVRYVAALAGSKVIKMEIELETDGYWFSPVYKPYEPHNSFSLLHYIRISKADYIEEIISKEEFKEAKKAVKN
jgi:hypothetical protein